MVVGVGAPSKEFVDPNENFDGVEAAFENAEDDDPGRDTGAATPRLPPLKPVCIGGRGETTTTAIEERHRMNIYMDKKKEEEVNIDIKR